MNDQTLHSGIPEQSSKLDLKITAESVSYLASAAKWAKFLAIVGFVFVGLFVIIAIISGAMMSSISSIYGGSGISGAALMVIYLLIALIYFFPVLYGFKFATNLQSAIESNNTPSLTESFKYLNKYCQFMGILMIIALVLIGISILLAIIGGVISTM